MQQSSIKKLHLGHPSILAAFGNEIGTKHIAPGEILGDNGRILAHNASALKGSSGGPIVDPISMRFVGIRMYISHVNSLCLSQSECERKNWWRGYTLFTINDAIYVNI